MLLGQDNRREKQRGQGSDRNTYSLHFFSFESIPAQRSHALLFRRRHCHRFIGKRLSLLRPSLRVRSLGQQSRSSSVSIVVVLIVPSPRSGGDSRSSLARGLPAPNRNVQIRECPQETVQENKSFDGGL